MKMSDFVTEKLSPYNLKFGDIEIVNNRDRYWMLLREIQYTLTDLPVTMLSKIFKTDCPLNKRKEQSAFLLSRQSYAMEVSV